MSYSLNSLKGLYIWDYIGDQGVIKGDTRSSDYSTYVLAAGQVVEEEVRDLHNQLLC